MDKFCACQERFKEVGDKKTRYPKVEYEHLHNCEYVRKRDSLILKAETSILDRHGYNLPGGRFTRLFADEMNRLSVEAGLIKKR